jgi:hypothetical protein
MLLLPLYSCGLKYLKCLDHLDYLGKQTVANYLSDTAELIE